VLGGGKDDKHDKTRLLIFAQYYNNNKICNNRYHSSGSGKRYNVIIARTYSERVKSPSTTPLGVGVTAYFVVIITVFFLPPDTLPVRHAVQISASPTTRARVCVWT